MVVILVSRRDSCLRRSASGEEEVGKRKEASRSGAWLSGLAGAASRSAGGAERGEGSGRACSVANCSTCSVVKHLRRASFGGAAHCQFASPSQVSKGFASIPTIAQQSVKGTKVMIRPPFESVDQVTHTQRANVPELFSGQQGDSQGQQGHPWDKRERAARTCDQALVRATDHLTRPRAGVWYGSSWHSCDASAATRTRPAPASHCLEQAR